MAFCSHWARFAVAQAVQRRDPGLETAGNLANVGIKDFREPGGTMPFVNIRLIDGRSQQRKDEISKRVTNAISEVLQLPKDDIWVLFEDIPAEDWYVGGTTVTELRKKTQK
jgi:4-oxalocrotonate tautomerase